MPLISALYASGLTLFILALGYQVTRVRHSERVGLGVGDSEKMQRAVRIHANAVENVPLALVLLVLLELQGASAWWIHGTGAALVIGRLLHVQGLMSSGKTSIGRYWGMVLTWASMGTMAIANGIQTLL